MPHFLRYTMCLTLSAFALVPAAACTSGGLETTTPGSAGGSAQNPIGNGVSGAGVGLGNAGASASSGAGSSSVDNSGGAMSVAGSSGSAGATQPVVGGSGGGAPAVVCIDKPPNNGMTCDHAVEYGWCSMGWLADSCQKICGKCSPSGSVSGGGSTSSGGNTGSGGTGGAPPPPIEIQGGASGWATRYWDCCKPACGWKGNVPGGTNPVASCSVTNQSFGSNYDQQSACPNGNNGPAYMCENFGPWSVSDTLAYGFAAVSKGSDYCGRCYSLQFTGKSHNPNVDTGSAWLSGKTLIVQAINNGGVSGDQFDLLIPGGGVGEFNACSKQWGSTDLGEQYGGFFLACQKSNSYDYAKSKACAAAKCQSVFSGKPDLLAGCNFFVNWFGAPDNPALVYKEVTCPDAITKMSGLHR